MDDLKLKAKKKVLEEIMSMMDERVSDELKSKSPKFKAIEIKTESEPVVVEDEEKLPFETEDDEVSDEEKQRIKELYEKYFN